MVACTQKQALEKWRGEFVSLASKKLAFSVADGIAKKCQEAETLATMTPRADPWDRCFFDA
jgi:hypothetical protein